MNFSRDTIEQVLMTKWLEMNPDYRYVGYRVPEDGENILYLTYNAFELHVANSRVSKYHIVQKKVKFKKGQCLHVYDKNYGYHKIGFFTRYGDDEQKIHVIGDTLFDTGCTRNHTGYSTDDYEITPIELGDLFGGV